MAPLCSFQAEAAARRVTGAAVVLLSSLHGTHHSALSVDRRVLHALQPTPRFECRLLLGRGSRFEDDCCLQ
jgi:hypothetical protein